MVIGAVLLLVVAPAVALVRTAFEEQASALASLLISAAPAVWATIWTGFAATLVALALGLPMALLTERTTVPGRTGLRLAMVLALIVPGYVAALGWLDAYGPGGLLDDLTGFEAAALVGPLGTIMVMGIEAAPIVFLLSMAALRQRAEPDLERAARASGATVLETWRTITLPLMAPALAGATVIAFVLSVTSFGVPVVLGLPAGLVTMTTLIYRDLAFSSAPDSFVQSIALALALAVGAALAIGLADHLLGRSRVDHSGAPASPAGPIDVSGAVGAGDRLAARARAVRWVAAGVAWGLMLVIVALPLLGLLMTALTRAPGLAPLPQNWTLEHFGQVLGPHTFEAFGNSVLLAGAAALGVIVLSGAAIAVRRGRAAGPIGSFLGLTFALPGSTLAVAVLLAYGVGLRDTLLIILVAYLAKFWAIGFRPLASGLDAIPADARRAARVSGAGAWMTTLTVVLPVLRPLVLASAIVIFMFGLHEVTMSSLLYGPGTSTLAVVVLGFQQLGDTGLTAALALLLTGVVLLCALPLLAGRHLLDSLGMKR
jgi:iron(III) transport system permease protein